MKNSLLIFCITFLIGMMIGWFLIEPEKRSNAILLDDLEHPTESVYMDNDTCLWGMMKRHSKVIMKLENGDKLIIQTSLTEE